jgi:hypothetical protein
MPCIVSSLTHARARTASPAAARHRRQDSRPPRPAEAHPRRPGTLASPLTAFSLASIALTDLAQRATLGKIAEAASDDEGAIEDEAPAVEVDYVPVRQANAARKLEAFLADAEKVAEHEAHRDRERERERSPTRREPGGQWGVERDRDRENDGERGRRHETGWEQVRSPDSMLCCGVDMRTERRHGGLWVR